MKSTIVHEEIAPVNAGLSRGKFVAGVGAAAAAAMTSKPVGALAGMPVPSLKALANMLGIDPKYSGKGMTFDCGIVFPLTGFGAIYGSHMMDLLNAPVRDILALGGPTFKLHIKDNKSGDPDSGVTAVRELGAEKVPMELASYAADLGAMTPGINKYKIFSLDGTGGTALFAEDKPYFWGSIAKTPTDAVPGVLKYIHMKMPGVKKIAFCGWDLGPLSDIIVNDMKKQMAPYGMSVVADERSAISETDYSANITKIKSAGPDLVLIAMYTEDPGYFMKQYALAGINKPVFAFAHTQAAQQIAGPAYENLYFGFDYFDAENPSNPWAAYFVNQFAKLGAGFKPDFYTANTYEDYFTLWDCIRRVLKKGGNPRDGAQLDAALRANPTFKSLYGGSSSGPGTIEFNLSDHSVKSRPMRILQFKGGRINTLAYFNIGGREFRLA